MFAMVVIRIEFNNRARTQPEAQRGTNAVRRHFRELWRWSGAGAGSKISAQFSSANQRR
jgi:hypothetical protein